MSGFPDIMPVHKEVFPLFYNKRMDVADGCPAGCFVDDISKVAGGICQLISAVLDVGYALVQLPALEIIIPKQVVEAFQNVR